MSASAWRTCDLFLWQSRAMKTAVIDIDMQGKSVENKQNNKSSGIWIQMSEKVLPVVLWGKCQSFCWWDESMTRQPTTRAPPTRPPSFLHISHQFQVSASQLYKKNKRVYMLLLEKISSSVALLSRSPLPPQRLVICGVGFAGPKRSWESGGVSSTSCLKTW